MKNFKNSFGIKGSQSQLLAFREWAESIGWNLFSLNSTTITDQIWFVGKDTKNTIVSLNSYYYAANLINLKIFNLPEQWKEAMGYASELEDTLEDKINKLFEIVLKRNADIYALGFKDAIKKTIQLLKEEGII